MIRGQEARRPGDKRSGDKSIKHLTLSTIMLIITLSFREQELKNEIRERIESMG